jgi:putative methionine-R-sulfoxide reductase with GAF domain
MNENKKITQTSADAATPVKLWGAIILAGILFLICAYFSSALYVEATTPAGYILLTVYAVGIVISAACIVLALRRQVELALQVEFYFLLVFPITSGVLTYGRTLTSTFAVLVIAAIVIRWLLPRSAWRWYTALTAGSLILAWVFDWINLPWRIQLKAAIVGPEAAVGFAVIFIIMTVTQVWRIGNTLRNKLIVAFLAVTLIPLIIISYITYNSSSTALTNDANQKLKAAAETTAADIDQFIALKLESVRSTGQFPAVVDYLSLPAYQRAGSPEEDRAIKLITALAREDPVFISSIAIYDIKGNTLLDTFTADKGSNKSDRVWFKDTMQTGLPYVSDVEHSASSDVPSLYFAALSHDVTGKVLGLIRVRYAASILQRLIVAETGLVGEQSYAVLLDSHHIRLAHGTNRDRVFKSIVPLAPAIAADLQSKGLLPPGTPEENATNLTDFEAGLNNLAQEPYFASDTDGDGALEQTATAPLTNKDWSAAFIQRQDVFLAPITTQTRNNLLVASLVAVAVAVAGFIFAQALAGPIIRLTQVAEAIAGGEINIQAKVETTDEIGILAGTFNRMTQQLRDFIVNLEERVAARTKDLATVAEVGNATSTILETDKLLKTVVELTKERFALYHSHIYLLDEKGENLVLAEGAGEPGRQMKARGLSIPLNREQSLVARAAREKKGVTVNDVTKAPDFLPNPLLPNTRSEMAVPMLVGETLIGVFDIQSDVAGRFTDSDISIQTTLAAQLASSVQNARSYERSKAQADFETLVNTIGQKIQHATTVEDTLQTAIREVGLALGASRVSANIGASRQNEGEETRRN